MATIFEYEDPIDTDFVGEADDEERITRERINTVLGMDHYIPDRDNDATNKEGEHIKVTLRTLDDEGSALTEPSAEAGKIKLYSKDGDSEKPEVFAIDEDGEKVQITSRGGLAIGASSPLTDVEAETGSVLGSSSATVIDYSDSFDIFVPVLARGYLYVDSKTSGGAPSTSSYPNVKVQIYANGGWVDMIDVSGSSYLDADETIYSDYTWLWPGTYRLCVETGALMDYHYDITGKLYICSALGFSTFDIDKVRG